MRASTLPLLTGRDPGWTSLKREKKRKKNVKRPVPFWIDRRLCSTGTGALLRAQCPPSSVCFRFLERLAVRNAAVESSTRGWKARFAGSKRTARFRYGFGVRRSTLFGRKGRDQLCFIRVSVVSTLRTWNFVRICWLEVAVDCERRWERLDNWHGMKSVGGQRLLTLTSSGMSPLYILLFLFSTVVPLWRYFPVAMPLHVVTRISCSDRTTSKDVPRIISK